MTTKDLFREYSSYYQFEEGDSEKLVDKEDFEKALVLFAKYHVKEALKKAAKSAHAYFDFEDGTSNNIEENSILNAYPENNIV